MFKKLIAVSLMALAAVGCTRIETGEVGLRVNASKQIEGSELMEGTWNQTLVGDVLTFPVRDIPLPIKDAKPLTKENTQIKDLDFTVIYNLNPTSVSDLWSKKSRSFHATGDGDWFLMFRYMETVANNAAQKTVRKYEALAVTDKREQIESEIKDEILKQLDIDNLKTSIVVTSVRVQNIAPNDAIVETATANVKAQNQLAVARTNVEIAKAEADRMRALAENGNQSIAYMNAQAQADIAKAVREGKVHTIIVPYDFKGIVNVK